MPRGAHSNQKLCGKESGANNSQGEMSRSVSKSQMSQEEKKCVGCASTKLTYQKASAALLDRPEGRVLIKPVHERFINRLDSCSPCNMFIHNAGKQQQDNPP